MSLVSTITTLQGRDLTPDEVKNLNAFQSQFDIDDDDPLIVVLAMMAQSQLIFQSLPAQLEKAADKTIELHRMAMREQAVLISKELVADLSGHIYTTVNGNNKRWIQYGACFISGVTFAALAGFGIWNFLR